MLQQVQHDSAVIILLDALLHLEFYQEHPG